jgi:hypothetical protein
MVSLKLTSFNVPASHGKWGGYRATKAVAWVVNIAPGQPQHREEARQRAELLQPLIAELKAKGLSLAKIAGELNKQKVATPRDGQWDHSSVRNVLKRPGLH